MKVKAVAKKTASVQNKFALGVKKYIDANMLVTTLMLKLSVLTPSFSSSSQGLFLIFFTRTSSFTDITIESQICCFVLHIKMLQPTVHEVHQLLSPILEYLPNLATIFTYINLN